MLEKIEQVTMYLAAASNGNPIVSTGTIILFWAMFSILEAQIECLIFGERFEHFLDPFFISCFIAWAAYAVWCCAVFNVSK